MEPSPNNRLLSLDQFRGYTVLGMFVVNFLGGHDSIPSVFHHHHTYCSYADTIMPQFLFAVGFAMRISFCSRMAKEGTKAAYRHFAGRCCGLILLGIVVYHLTGHYETWDSFVNQDWWQFPIKTFKREPFATLTHIGLTSLWVLPVIGRSARVRFGFACFSGLLHVGLSHWYYYVWNLVNPFGIDGGPLGFLTWTIPLIAGSLVRDLFLHNRRPLPWLMAGASLFMISAIALSFLNPDATWPFVKPADTIELNYWIMSQRAGSITYLLFTAGFAMAVYGAFWIVCDVWKLSSSLLGMLGRNALAAYLVHDMVDGAVTPFCPKDAPLWWTLGCLAVFLSISIVFMRQLDRNRLWLKL